MLWHAFGERAAARQVRCVHGSECRAQQKQFIEVSQHCDYLNQERVTKFCCLVLHAAFLDLSPTLRT